MKNFSLIIQLILVLAVAGIYILHFRDKNPSVLAVEQPLQSDAYTVNPMVNSGIVFINSDSLLENYIFFKNQKSTFETKQNKIRSELESESNKLQRDVESYQQRAIGMTDLQRQIEEEQLMIRQQKLMQRKDDLLDRLDEEQAKSSEELYDRLSKYLKDYNKDKNYQFILGFQRGGGILFASDSLDITREVLTGLNSQYSREFSK